MKLAKNFHKAWSSWWLWVAGALSSVWSVITYLDFSLLEQAAINLEDVSQTTAAALLAFVSIGGAVVRAIGQDEEEDKEGEA